MEGLGVTVHQDFSQLIFDQWQTDKERDTQRQPSRAEYSKGNDPEDFTRYPSYSVHSRIFRRNDDPNPFAHGVLGGTTQCSETLRTLVHISERRVRARARWMGNLRRNLTFDWFTDVREMYDFANIASPQDERQEKGRGHCTDSNSLLACSPIEHSSGEAPLWGLT